tara:strand:- start:18865 stop:19335 length:471 start_codon:yes stop_codon:yes gene_type:complete
MFPEHISKKELEKSQTATRKGIDNKIPSRLLPNAIRLAWFLETLREKLSDHYGQVIPIIISSGYRSPVLNGSIGGSATSVHCKALAADITAVGISTYELANFIRVHMVEEGWDQLIYEFGDWVHIGLSEGQMRQEVLTAMKVNRRTVYELGIVEIV